MRKLSVVITMLVAMSMLLVACGTAATPTAAPTTAPATSAPATSAPATAVATTAPAATAAPTVIPVTNFPRNETLYTGGTQWGPVSTFNPFNGGHAMGTLGLVYETLFLYDPMTDTFIPWLASSGSWTSTSPATYEIKLRSGLTWQDGQPLTADDVVFTWNLAKTDTLNFSDIWSANELTAVNKVDAQTVDFVFGSTPPYQEFANYLYNVPVVPQHLFSTMSAKDVETGTNPNPVGSGPYKYYGYDQTKMIWERNDSWWGIQALGYKMAPKYIIDLVNTSNQNSLGLVLQGDEDLNNNYLPGIATLLAGGYPLETYYPSAPYNLSVNTAWLEMNLQEKPLSDLAFRQALAYGIDPAAIVSQDYDNMVQAADPTGLLPVWSKYEDQSVIKQYGVTYDPAKVKTVLTAAGYKMGKDGFWTEPDGTPINLTITCPQGWSDWMEALTIIQTQLAAVGIQVTPTYPAAADWTNAQVQGKFDLTLNNAAAISNTPWSYYNWMFYSDLADIPTTQGGNFDRYNNPALFALVAKLGQTPTDDLTDMQSVISQIQTIQLQNLPIIPLWYNGAWAQMSTANWTNWPGSGDGQAHYYPVTWNGYWNMTAILMLANLKPATP